MWWAFIHTHCLKVYTDANSVQAAQDNVVTEHCKSALPSPRGDFETLLPTRHTLAQSDTHYLHSVYVTCVGTCEGLDRIWTCRERM